MKLLLKISLIISLIGIFLLLLISLNLPIKKYKINEINKDLINSKVQITGKVTKINIFSGLQIITISDKTDRINVLVDKPINLSINKTLFIIGTVDEYKGSLEINAEKITF